MMFLLAQGAHPTLLPRFTCKSSTRLSIPVLDHLDDVSCIHPTDWSVAVARRDHHPFGINHKLCRLDDSAPLFPPSSQGIRHLPAHPEANRERDLRCNLSCLLQRISAGRYDSNTQFIEFCFKLCEADQLSAAIWSPVSAVEKHDPIASTELIRQHEMLAIHGVQYDSGKRSPDSCHCSHRHLRSYRHCCIMDRTVHNAV